MGSPQSIRSLSDRDKVEHNLETAIESFMVFTSPTFVHSVELNVSDQPHPYHVENSELALAAWQDEIARKPSMFNGMVLLERELNYEDNRLIGTSHIVPYSTFLHWVQNENGEGDHLFALGLIISKEGWPIQGQMADHTFNAGKCYAPSGSLDTDDIQNGKVDLFANIKRELGEETDIDLSKAEMQPGFQIFRHGRKTIAVNRCLFDLPAEDLCKQINDFIASDLDAELSKVFVIKDQDQYPENLTGYMNAILDWHFDTICDK